MRKTISVVATLLMSTAGLNAAVTKTQAERLHDAAVVLHEIHRAPDKDIPMDLWEKASCVAVFPSVKKAAFIIGGEYGKGVISCRNGADWSAPVFMTLQKGSIGFQIGGEAVDLVLLVMNEHGIGRASGVVVDRRHYALWTLRGGKVVSLRNYLDRAEALKAVGLEE